MNLSEILVAWSVNLLVGLGLTLLGWTMWRRPDRVWIGVRVARTPEEIARVRRANRGTAPWLLLLGIAEILSGVVVLLGAFSPLWLAVVGLTLLLLALATVSAAAILSR